MGEEEEVIRLDAVDTEVNRSVRERTMEHTVRVRWPKANGSEGKEVVKDVSVILSRLRGNAIGKLEKMGEIIYSCGVGRFGVFAEAFVLFFSTLLALALASGGPEITV